MARIRQRCYDRLVPCEGSRDGARECLREGATEGLRDGPTDGPTEWRECDTLVVVSVRRVLRLSLVLPVLALLGLPLVYESVK